MQNNCISELSTQHVPSISAVNSTRLAEGSGIREEIVGGAAKSSAVRTSASALQLQMKWAASSLTAPQCLQDGSWTLPLVFLVLNLEAFLSSPLHPTSRRILKLFSLVIFTSPTVAAQWGAGFRSLRLQELRWYASHSSRNSRCTFNARNLCTCDFQTFGEGSARVLLSRVEKSWRLCLARRSWNLLTTPFTLLELALATRTLLEIDPEGRLAVATIKPRDCC